MADFISFMPVTYSCEFQQLIDVFYFIFLYNFSNCDQLILS